MFWISRISQKEMIVVRLKGGLGNQMFQYAFASILAEIKKTSLKIDSQFFELSEENETITARTFELSIFDNAYIQATMDDISSFKNLSELNRLRRKIGLNYPKKYNETTSMFQKNAFYVKTPVYLNGYFQSYKYYLGYENFVRRLFSFSRTSMDDENKYLLFKIHQLKTISIHIRRGDYVTNPSVYSKHGVCSLDYYLEAIKLALSKFNDATLVFFSDDYDWITKTFEQLPYNKIIVGHNKGKESWKDMLLMSECNHNIIANSSFSWWAAWLNKNPDKIVIAPKKWFADNEQGAITKDLIPPEWIRL